MTGSLVDVRVLAPDANTGRRGAEPEARPLNWYHAATIYGVYEADQGDVDEAAHPDPGSGGADGVDGKTNLTLDERSQNVLTTMEELQDTVLRAIKEDLSSVDAAEPQSLTEHIGTVKPMWKKTWEELQSIVEEQQFLNHQEFLTDLIEDRKAITEDADGGHGATAARRVMLEIRSATVDPERRLKGEPEEPGAGAGGQRG
ncbi:hypothetical protein EDB83DRAFT_2565845 [Lactarius deliciosus]|nr:hypothetical protein EDB83DRAFT_2565845 [Lactarius deliciosus]